ncbi:MAG: serine hydrolase family protein [Gammaproteobacteria bacterium]|nr:serine hydrolase family protein [Gammaproteobacteria bacterium]
MRVRRPGATTLLACPNRSTGIGWGERAVALLRASHPGSAIRRRRGRIALALILVAAALGGCASAPSPLSAPASYTARTVYGEAFSLRYWHRGLTNGAKQSPQLVHVYIEGDGRAWRHGNPPTDPTPRKPVGYALAIGDPHTSVVYIARPCQYLQPGELAACDPRLWTSARYSQIVIAAVNTALDNIRSLDGTTRRFGLIGHSGGGTVGALVAARRQDVAWLITAGANLDHRAWTTHHRVPPLALSANPVDDIERLKSLPQLHLAGEHDTVVPSTLTRRFMARFPPDSEARMLLVPGATHTCCWAEVLAEVLPRISHITR